MSRDLPPPDPQTRTAMLNEESLAEQRSWDGPPVAPFRPSTPPAGKERRDWRERLPELVAAIGATLVTLAIVGFVTSSWDNLTDIGKSIVVAAVAVGLTFGGKYVESVARQALARVVPLLYAAASAAVAGSATILGLSLAPDAGRLVIAAAGLAAAAHATWIFLDDRQSVTRILTIAAAGLYASGPIGTSTADRYTTTRLEDWFAPIAGILDPAYTSELFLVVSAGWAIVGAALMWVATTQTGAARHPLTTTGTAVLFAAAAGLNVSPNAIGAFGALMIVLSYLLYGLVASRPGIVTAGAVGAFLIGLRVLFGLFTGQVAVTIAALVVGVGMLAWSVRAAQQKQADSDNTDNNADELD